MIARLSFKVSNPIVEEMSKQPIHICYYSNRCQYSKSFLEELKKTSYLSEFHFVCVDPSPNRPALPTWLKQTPTLVIRGEKEPRVNSDVTNWLYERKLRDSTPAPGAANAEPEFYNALEMGSGFRDSYSMLDEDTTAQGNGGMRIQHSFTYLNGNENTSSREATAFQGSNVDEKRSKKEQLLDQQMEAFMRDRDHGMPKPVMRQ